MHILDANEIFGVTAYTYDRIMEAGGKYWPDTFAVYFKLLEQTRIQKTNRTFTLNKFLMNFFGWWDDRVSRAKKILKNLWLIDDIVIRDWGKIVWHYVQVNYLIDENKVRNTCSTYILTTTTENQGVESTMSGEIETNALSTKHINAWSTKQETRAYSEQSLPLSTQHNSKDKEVKATASATKSKSKPKRKEYPADFEEIRRIYPQNWWKKFDIYKLWCEYNEKERADFLVGAKHLHIYWEYIRHGDIRRSNRMDRWMDGYVVWDEKEKLLETMKQVVNIKDESIMNEAINIAKEFFGEEYVRWALIKNTQRITLDFH